MTLQEALKVSDLVVCNRHPNLVYFLRGGHLYCRSLSKECRSDMSLAEILTTDWMAYIEPKIEEPCEHEPELKMRGLKEILELPPNAPLDFVCRHCLVPLRSKGWEVV